jgi:hypothetical protein
LDVALAKISVLTCNEVAVYTDLLSFEPLRSLVSRFRSQFLPSANGREVNFQGKKRSNETHQSTTDPDARLYKKSKGSEAKMSYLGHALMENRHGLLVDTMVTLADGTAERDAALLPTAIPSSALMALRTSRLMALAFSRLLFSRTSATTTISSVPRLEL